jgi:acetyltransferase-like isoleucine patch superfamily enzyme
MNKENLLDHGGLLQRLRGRSLLSSAGDLAALLRARLTLSRATRSGHFARLWGRALIDNQGEMIIGDRVRLKGTLTPVELVTGPHGRLEIGANVFINYGCSIAAFKLVVIGPDCSIGPYANLIDNDFHRIEPERRSEMPESRPVILEANVWLGSRVIVLPGVTIGRDSVIGAGSVVTRDIPPRSLAAGVPARVIRTL